VSGTRITGSTPVPSRYLATVYGRRDGTVRLSALEVLYSALSVRLSDGGDVMLAAVRQDGQCWAFTGMGDVPCCTGFTITKAWYGGGGWASRLGQLFYNPLYRPAGVRSWNHSDGSWVEVTRWPTGCIAMARTRTNGRGMPTPCEGQLGNESYGVWFFTSGGSGVWVNVGHSLRFPSRRLAKAFLCRHGHAAACTGHPELTDRHWCRAALQLGYDSLQVGQGRSSWVKHQSGIERELAEIVICTHPPRPVCGACPPLPLRSGRDASLVCNCDDGIGILNCGRFRPTPCRSAAAAA